MELLGHELGGDGVDADDRALDEGVEGELIDATGCSAALLEQLLDGPLGEELLAGSGVPELEGDVVPGVLEVEPAEGVDEAQAGVERLERRVAQCSQDGVGAGDEDAEAVFGVEGVVGEPPEDVEQLGDHGLGVVEDEHHVGPAVGAVGGEMGVGLVEEVAGVLRMGRSNARLIERRKPTRVDRAWER